MLSIPQPRWIAVDFDFTLSHFQRGIESVLDLFTSRGVPREEVREAWLEAEAQGFSPGVFHNAVAARVGEHFAISDFEKDFAEWLSSSVTLYADCVPTLAAWSRLQIPVTIVTLGDAPYQRQKIAIVGLEHLEVIVVPGVQGKLSVIHEIVGRSGTPGLFIEDNASLLDQVHDAFSSLDVMTAWIKRPDSPYVLRRPHRPHVVITELAELAFNR